MTVDYRDTIFLPQTDFPMRAGLPKKEPEIQKRWEEEDLYGQLRRISTGREKFILHDGPPYANGNIHIGTGLNKILKDLINRTQQMLGKDANYVPGWDCHGLPIEWKIEEQYRAKGRDRSAVPINDFRRECREFAEHWIEVQRQEFKRLGVIGRWDDPYLTMTFDSEALIAAELMKFAAGGMLYRGSKPVMWSVVEGTALAEAEVEYLDHQSDTIWAKFPVVGGPDFLFRSSIVIWTTTPWTIPGNRAICFSPRVSYGLYKVDSAPEENWARVGDKLILADSLAEQVMDASRVGSFSRLRDVSTENLKSTVCAHPLRETKLGGYDFHVPLLAGEHVSDDAGTGFVHTAPGHGREDFEIWTAEEPRLKARGIDAAIPFTVGADGAFTEDAPGFTGEFVITDKGKKGGANRAVIAALAAADALIARGRLTHQYPHSWRSKKPVIFRNTPQWFIGMGDGEAEGLRKVALGAIDATRFVPAAGRNRLYAMIEQRPDWVISRQRAWGVPIAVFADPATGEVLNDPAVNERIVDAFREESSDAWFTDGARERFLGAEHRDGPWEKVDDILDVWFESGCTHAFCLEQELDELVWPASLYLEGSDQHRGWFHSSLLESCGTRGRAPYDAVLTHGFVTDEDGRKMSKSLGNVTAPQEICDRYGADILRLWVVASDYSEDLRIGPEIVKQQADTYRRLRNTLRFILGNVAGFSEEEKVAPADLPELERWVLHRLHALDGELRKACDDFEFHGFYAALHHFCATELSAFYLDIRKDALYCDRPDSLRRRAARTVLDILFDCLTAWLAPVICFTAEEAWTARHGASAGSVHLRTFPDIPADWRDDALAAKWSKIRALRRVVTGALEEERAAKRIGSSLDAAPAVEATPDYVEAMNGVDLAEIAITSAATLTAKSNPRGAFSMPEIAGVAVTPAPAEHPKCARCWKKLPDVGADPDVPETCGRCADAVRAHRVRTLR
ncbi:MAG: isoleucine--tRNA ligase [Rhodospirillaceae bacterium]|nr:isoleucine--tRNA ligase [Rhodospirillaceae bacterium]MYF86508.1 isoleucine--tRNA ligase [Rhodospirillaceae bacterium]MYH36857.1 isoleucine--tRNA ligase [Rhodospirillaceae bacterium]MYK12675.1 isoleucine--tRNA ligase [Rhodospirillaceae bacterium]